MDKRTFLKKVAALAASSSIASGTRSAMGSPTGVAEWLLNVEVLESCSCPVFCQCFFTYRKTASGRRHGPQSFPWDALLLPIQLSVSGAQRARPFGTPRGRALLVLGRRRRRLREGKTRMGDPDVRPARFGGSAGRSAQCSAPPALVSAGTLEVLHGRRGRSDLMDGGGAERAGDARRRSDRGDRAEYDARLTRAAGNC